MSHEELIERVQALRAAGHSPKQIARALGLRPAAARELVRAIASERAAATPATGLVGCWVSRGWSEGLTVSEHVGWPDAAPLDPTVAGLASVLVARKHRHGSVSVCGYLVDVWCLGVKDALGPRVMKAHELAAFRRLFFRGYEQAPQAAPIDLAQHLVLGAAEYARALGFEPHADFEPARGHLGPWRGPSGIRFGRDGVPVFVQGPHDDAPRILRTLERSVGRGNLRFAVSDRILAA